MRLVVGCDAHIAPNIQDLNNAKRDDVGIVPYDSFSLAQSTFVAPPSSEGGFFIYNAEKI